MPQLRFPPAFQPTVGYPIGILCLVLGLARADFLPAQERFHRLFDSEDGLNPTAVRSLAQDTSGFLWIGTVEGLYRYDGRTMRRWVPETLDRTISALSASASGILIALEEGGDLYMITPAGAKAVRGPSGSPMTGVRDAAVDSAGHLWLIRDEEVWVARQSRWAQVHIPLRPGDHPRLIRPDAGTGAVLASGLEVWRIAPSGSAERILEAPQIVDLHATDDGRLLALDFFGRVFVSSAAGARLLFWATEIGAGGRGISVLERKGTIWVAIDRYLVAWRPDRSPEILGNEAGIESGGALLVDHEGSLWMGSFIGLYQFPEPETRIWTERSGLPSNHTRYLAKAGDTVWVTTWQGTGYIREEPRGWSAGTTPYRSSSRIFLDSRGSLWMGADEGLLELRNGEILRRHARGPTGLYGFHEADQGEIWLATSEGLHFRESSDGAIQPIRATPFGEWPTAVETVRIDRRGEVWASSGERVCHTRRQMLLHSDGSAAWSCDSIPGAVHLNSLVEMANGVLWASTSRLGVLQLGDDGWAALPPARAPPLRTVLSLVPSPSGGIWIVGHGVLHRMTETPGHPDEWQLEERLLHWHGLPVISGTHLAEDANGGVWVTSSRGVAYVPPAARTTPLDPPPVALVDVRSDNEPVARVTNLELPHEKNRLELRFAALSYRDPSLIRYQVRLSPEEPWEDTAGEPFFRWVDLPPGEYRAQVRASLDGQRWSEAPSYFGFSVRPPWYRQPWALGLFLAGITLGLYAGHRIRIAHLLDLERQRTRIAMDLHDEVGSGLGSIGILSGLLATDGLEAAERRRMAGEVVGTATELGASLSNIVWALDPRAKTMEELAARLAEHGRRLFAQGTTRFITRFPDRWPDVHLPQPIRRNVLLIGLEALHNAERHAEAQEVELGLDLRGDTQWTLSILDDGVGLRASPERSGAGLGFSSMHRRAAEIGAELRIVSLPAGGTEVTLAFRPRSRGWRLHRPPRESIRE
jgi:ligand-binding sensor domain-containing protein